MSIGLVPSVPGGGGSGVDQTARDAAAAAQTRADDAYDLAESIAAGHELATGPVVINAADYATLQEAFDAALAWRGHMNGYTCTLALEAKTYTVSTDKQVLAELGYFPEFRINGVYSRDYDGINNFSPDTLHISIINNTEAESSNTDEEFTKVYDVKYWLTNSEAIYDLSQFYAVGDIICPNVDDALILQNSIKLAAMANAPGIVIACDATGMTIRHKLSADQSDGLISFPTVSLPYTVDISEGGYTQFYKYSTIFETSGGSVVPDYSYPFMRFINGTMQYMRGIAFLMRVNEQGNGVPAISFNNVNILSGFTIPMVFIAYDSGGAYSGTITVGGNSILSQGLGLNLANDQTQSPIIEDFSNASVSLNGLVNSLYGLIVRSSNVLIDGTAASGSPSNFGSALFGEGSSTIISSGQFTSWSNDDVTALEMARIYVSQRSDGEDLNTTPAIGVMSSTGSWVYS